MTTFTNALLWLVGSIPGSRVVLPAWVSALALGFAGGGGITYGVFDLWGTFVPIAEPIRAAGAAKGDVPFPLVASGWLNGSAPSWSDFSGRVVVLDVWADW